MTRTFYEWSRTEPWAQAIVRDLSLAGKRAHYTFEPTLFDEPIYVVWLDE